MTIKLYNTLTRKKEIFRSIKKKTVGIYSCGPTVYQYAHIGNFRTFIFSDVLVRSMKYFGYKVKHIMNITDVGHLTSDADTGDDKLMIAAKRERKTAWDIAKFYTTAFIEDAEKLNINLPQKLPRATDHIKEQIALIKKLDRGGYTYITKDGVYFDISKFKAYGKLSRQKLTDKKGGKRVATKNKKNVADFALWKFSPKNSKRDMEWKSPWGVGFPGWHVECSAMSKKYLGQPFDIHIGGIDHLPVHHENEIAQSVVAYGKPLANYWMHGEFLVWGKPGREVKMSKSLRNIKTINELIQETGVDPLAFRYLLFTTHYRQKLYFNIESLRASDQALERLRQYVKELPRPGRRGVEEVERRFVNALANDLDTPRALALAWKLVRSKKYNLAEVKRSLLRFDKLFGFDLDRVEAKFKISKSVKELISKREEARRSEDWPVSDDLRKEIKKAGYLIEDTPKGPKIKPL